MTTPGGTAGPHQVLIELAPQLLAQADETTPGRVAALLKPAGDRAPTVRLTATESGIDPVRIVLDGADVPLPSSAPAEALAYVLGQPTVLRNPDAGTVARQLTGSADGPAAALAQWLASLCRTEPFTSKPALPTKPGELEILIDPQYLRDLTSGGGTTDDLFPFARDGLFVELGVTLPAFHFRRDPTLRPGGFAFRLAGHDVPPRIGLTAGTILVNDTVEQLRLLGVQAEASANPATGAPASIAPAEHDEMLVAAGLTTWTPMGYLILCFADAVRQHAYRYVSTDLLGEILESAGRAWPDLEEMAAGLLPQVETAEVLRDLVRERVSIRNQHRILELLLRWLTEDEPPEDQLAYVRAGLAEQIASSAARGARTLVAYLIDPELEHEFTEAPGLAAGRLREAVARELASLPPTAQVPVMLSQDSIRMRVRDALLPRFPRMHVLGYRDIPATFNIQPVARISAS